MNSTPEEGLHKYLCHSITFSHLGGFHQIDLVGRFVIETGEASVYKRAITLADVDNDTVLMMMDFICK